MGKQNCGGFSSRETNGDIPERVQENKVEVVYSGVDVKRFKVDKAYCYPANRN